MLGIPEAVTAVVSQVIGPILNRVLPREKMGEAEAAKLELEIQTALMNADWQQVQAQLAINLEEAKHESLFVAGWRPFIGWVCGSAFAYHFVIQSFLIFLVKAAGVDLPELPELDTGTLMAVTTGLLGLGALRTYEKVQGATPMLPSPLRRG